jgi:hypothetical protein
VIANTPSIPKFRNILPQFSKRCDKEESVCPVLLLPSSLNDLYLNYKIESRKLIHIASLSFLGVLTFGVYVCIRKELLGVLISLILTKVLRVDF